MYLVDTIFRKVIFSDKKKMIYPIFNNYRNDFTLNIQQSVLDQYKRKFRYALKAILLLDVKDKKPIN